MRRTVETLAFASALAVLAYEVTRSTPWPLAVGLAVVVLVGVFVSVGDRRAHAHAREAREEEQRWREQRALASEHGVVLPRGWEFGVLPDPVLDLRWDWPRREQS